MSAPIVKVGESTNTEALLWTLREHPDLWNRNTGRTAQQGSPHREVDDIWVRYAVNEAESAGPHDAIWYPAEELLGTRAMCLPLMAHLGGTRLGGVLITRIPPCKQVYPHTDDGWHAKFYEKFAIQLASAPGQKFCFAEAELETRPGDVYWFDNSQEHWVVNPTPYERVTMIVCMRRT